MSRSCDRSRGSLNMHVWYCMQSREYDSGSGGNGATLRSSVCAGVHGSRLHIACTHLPRSCLLPAPLPHLSNTHAMSRRRLPLTLCSTPAAAPSPSTSGSCQATCRVSGGGLLPGPHRIEGSEQSHTRSSVPLRLCSQQAARSCPVPYLPHAARGSPTGPSSRPRAPSPHPALPPGDALSYLFSHRGTSEESDAASNTGWGPNQIQAGLAAGVPRHSRRVGLASAAGSCCR